MLALTKFLGSSLGEGCCEGVEGPEVGAESYHHPGNPSTLPGGKAGPHHTAVSFAHPIYPHISITLHFLVNSTRTTAHRRCRSIHFMYDMEAVCMPLDLRGAR